MLTHAQSQILVAFIVFKSFCVDRWKGHDNASVDENIMLRFLRDENEHFWNRIKVDVT